MPSTIAITPNIVMVATISIVSRNCTTSTNASSIAKLEFLISPAILRTTRYTASGTGNIRRWARLPNICPSMYDEKPNM